MTNRVWDAPNIHVMSGDIWAFDKPQRLYKRVFELSPKRGQTRTLDEKKGVELTKKKKQRKEGKGGLAQGGGKKSTAILWSITQPTSWS